MKQFLLSFVLTSGFAASLAAPAFAQDNPNTTQTDQSEEDWRKSKKKTTTDDPWNGFKNTNGWGQGTQRSMSPVDMLPEESRRFLMKERAERLAEAGVGEPIDTSFEPSDEAKSDPSLESDEKSAWSEMMKDMGGSGMPTAGDPNADPNGQGGGAPQIPTQVGEYGGSSDNADAPPSSVMRGGSSATVSDILAQIKGGGAAPSAETQNKNAQGQSQQKQAPTAAQMQAQSQGQANAQQASQNSVDGQDSPQAAAQAEAAADAQASRTPEAISPLDRLKQTREERESSGRRSSASDYLKRGN